MNETHFFHTNIHSFKNGERKRKSSFDERLSAKLSILLDQWYSNDNQAYFIFQCQLGEKTWTVNKPFDALTSFLENYQMTLDPNEEKE